MRSYDFPNLFDHRTLFSNEIIHTELLIFKTKLRFFFFLGSTYKCGYTAYLFFYQVSLCTELGGGQSLAAIIPSPRFLSSLQPERYSAPQAGAAPQGSGPTLAHTN